MRFQLRYTGFSTLDSTRVWLGPLPLDVPGSDSNNTFRIQILRHIKQRGRDGMIGGTKGGRLLSCVVIKVLRAKQILNLNIAGGEMF